MPQDDKSTPDGEPGGDLPRFSLSPFFVGLRYLLSKKLSYLAIVGVMISVGTLVVVMSVMTGFRQKMMGIIRGYHSDVTVQTSPTELGEKRAGSQLYGMTDWREVAEKVRAVDHVEHVAPFLQGFALLKIEGTGYMEHVFFRGVDPEQERGVTRLEDYLQESTEMEDLEATHPDAYERRGGRIPSCFVGSAMSEFLGVNVWRRQVQVVLVTATEGLNAEFRKFRIFGVFKTGRWDWDRGVVVIPLEEAMRFVDSDGGVTGLNIRLDDYSNHPGVIRELERKLGSGYVFNTWEEQEKNLLEAVVMERFLMAIILSFIIVLAGFCIAAILAFTVQEKRKDIGILKAVGFSRGMIGSVFLVNGLTIGVVGAVLGAVGGRLFTDNINAIEGFIEYYTNWTPFPEQIYYFNRIPTAEGLAIPLAVAAGAVFCSLVFSLLPALKAARLDPVQTLRFE